MGANDFLSQSEENEKLTSSEQKAKESFKKRLMQMKMKMCGFIMSAFCMSDIYINSNLKPLTKFPSSSRSIKLKSNLPWNIYQMIMKTILFSTGIVISYAMKQAISL